MATQSEQAWISQNRDLAQQMFGTLTPPDGSVAQFVKGWYDQQGATAPALDATDSAIYQEFGYTHPSVSPVAPTPQLPSGTTSVGNGLSGLTSTVPQTTFTQAPTPAVGGGNYNQVQNATQGGQFATSGQSVEQQTGTTEQTTQGTTTTKPIDTLGLGGLLAAQAGGVGEADAARLAFLKDVMATGGMGFNEQLDAGIRKSLSGPGMVGTGDSARARAAGYAAADVGRNNLNQRLAASSQLAGPTGLSSLVSAGTPYIGTEQNVSGTTTGLSDLIKKGAETSTGVTTGQSSQAGAGQIPQGQPVKTGSCVLCTAALELKLSNHHRVLRRVINHKLRVDPRRFHNAARGYFAVFTPLARYLLSHRRLATLLWPLAKAVVYEELRVSGRRLPFRPFAWAIHWIGHTFCAAVGATFNVPGKVTDPEILRIAHRERVLYTLKEV